MRSLGLVPDNTGLLITDTGMGGLRMLWRGIPGKVFPIDSLGGRVRDCRIEIFWIDDDLLSGVVCDEESLLFHLPCSFLGETISLGGLMDAHLGWNEDFLSSDLWN